MKTLKLTILLISSLLWSCGKNDVPEFEEQPIAEDYNVITVDEAVDLAIKATVLDPESNKGRGAEKTVSNPFKQVAKFSNSKSRSSSLDLYIVSFDDDGFAIISTKMIENPIIGYIPHGKFDEYSENENFNYALMNAINLPVDTINPDLEHIRLASKIDTVYVDAPQVGPLINVRWGQKGIYGMCCPNKVSGCSNTALAQAMSYYEYPQTITLTHYNNKTLALNWPEMKYHINNHMCICSDETHEMIGRLMRESGYRAGSAYNEGATATSVEGIVKAAKSFGYNSYGLSLSYDTPWGYYSTIRNGKLILMYGAQDAEYNGGHMWVCDGAVGMGYTINCYINEAPANYIFPIWTLYASYNKESYYYHHNWGGDGQYNGWLLANVYTPADSGMNFGFGAGGVVIYPANN